MSRAIEERPRFALIEGEIRRTEGDELRRRGDLMKRDRNRAAGDDEACAVAISAIDQFTDGCERSAPFDRVRVIEDEQRRVCAFSRRERVGEPAADVFRRAETRRVDGVERRHRESERSQTSIEMCREDGEIRVRMIEAIPKFRTGPRLEETSRENGFSVARTGGDRDDAYARLEPSLELRALEPCGKRRRRRELQPMDEHGPDFLPWGGPFPESIGLELSPRVRRLGGELSSQPRVVHEVGRPKLRASGAYGK